MSKWSLIGAAAALVLAAGTASAQDVLRVGTEGAYPPWNATNSAGELEGFEIDLANALCQEAGMTCEFVAQAWDGIIPALLNGNYDVIMAGMSVTEERKQTIAFTRGYAVTPIYMLAPKDSEFAGMTDLEAIKAALDGKTVGAQAATIHARFIEERIPGATLQTYQTQDELNLDMAAGRIDVGLADGPAWDDFLESPEGANYVKFGPPLNGTVDPIFGEGVGIGLRKEDAELKAKLDAALCGLYEKGITQDLSTKWFGDDYAIPCN
jgi:lysine-arginine-ornithine-binding protein